MMKCSFVYVLHAVIISCYIGKLVVHGLNYGRLCGWSAWNWLWYQLSFFKANFVKLRMPFLALCNISLLYYVKKNAFCVKIFTNPVSVLWTVLILWLFEHNSFLPGSVSPPPKSSDQIYASCRQWSNSCAIWITVLSNIWRVVLNQLNSFFLFLSFCSHIP